MTRVATVDCGTNSLRLLVADVDPAAGVLRDVVRRLEIVRLGQDVDRTGRLAPEAVGRTLTVLADYAADVARLGAERVRVVATSATRDAANRDEFTKGVVDILGVTPVVVSGAEEAALSFAGATRELRGRRDIPAPYLVVDIGGGSTEFVLGRDSVEAVASVDLGCVRLTERHLRHDPPLGDEVAAVEADIDAGLQEVQAAMPLERVGSLVGVAGTITTVAAIALGLAAYDAGRIHLSRIPANRVCEVSDRLLGMTRAERAAVPVMHPGRVDVIVAGALILATVVDRLGVDEVVVSEHDILDGLAWSLA
jgi:exopolyphosphatase/guanosine-5'-triphosphate,3'-diphosphate pyrophosphatase